MVRSTFISGSARFGFLTAAAVIALAIPAMAEDAATTQVPAEEQSAFSQALKSIRGWFGPDVPQTVAPTTATTAAIDDTIQVPPAVPGADVQAIEPAAGMDDDMLQVPPPYYGPQSDASPRATSFDNNASVAAFGDAPGTVAANSTDAINAIAPAAGDGAIDRSQLDCDAILKAAETAEEGDQPEANLVAACKAPADSAAVTPASPADPATDAPVGVPMLTEPAQPAFEMTPPPSPLPATQPAAGEDAVAPTKGGRAAPKPDAVNKSQAPATTTTAPVVETIDQ